jgi:hypothetical protein
VLLDGPLADYLAALRSVALYFRAQPADSRAVRYSDCLADSQDYSVAAPAASAPAALAAPDDPQADCLAAQYSAASQGGRQADCLAAQYSAALQCHARPACCQAVRYSEYPVGWWDYSVAGLAGAELPDPADSRDYSVAAPAASAPVDRGGCRRCPEPPAPLFDSLAALVLELLLRIRAPVSEVERPSLPRLAVPPARVGFGEFALLIAACRRCSLSLPAAFQTTEEAVEVRPLQQPRAAAVLQAVDAPLVVPIPALLVSTAR